MLEQIDLKLTSCGINLNASSQLQTERFFSIVPNPARDWIYIKSNQNIITNEVIVIYDFTGKIVLSKKLNSAVGICIAELPSGMYFLKTEFGTKIVLKEN